MYQTGGCSKIFCFISLPAVNIFNNPWIRLDFLIGLRLSHGEHEKNMWQWPEVILGVCL